MVFTIGEFNKLIFETGEMYHKLILDHYYDQYRGQLTYLQVLALEAITKEGPIRQKDLATKLAVPKQHAAKLIDHLISQGYAYKVQSNVDNRAISLYATEMGKALVDRRIDDNFAYLLSLVTILTNEEQEQLMVATKTMHTLLGKLQNAAQDQA